jgi:Glycosyl transferase family group 2
MQVAHHYFENGIAHFTRRINKCISMACANGEVAPFVGHNAFLRWSALQDAAFNDPEDNDQKKIWSETNVSEDFDMALRLQVGVFRLLESGRSQLSDSFVQLKGYIIRWATYSEGGFKEGVSLTCDDELNRWQKYSYGGFSP